MANKNSHRNSTGYRGAGYPVFIHLLKFDYSIIAAIILSGMVVMLFFVVVVSFAIGMNMFGRFIMMVLVKAHIYTHSAGKTDYRIQ